MVWDIQKHCPLWVQLISGNHLFLDTTLSGFNLDPEPHAGDGESWLFHMQFLQHCLEK